MAVNSPKLAGRDAVSRHGWAYAHRFLLARRAVQLLVLAMFLAGPWWGVWILKGNYSS
ncbi:MAG: quinol dehydrogenase ferredoxin subunit NapH, partial [Plesiomonas sp.]